MVSLEWQLTESCRDGRHTEFVYCHSLHSLAREAGFIERKTPGTLDWEVSHVFVLCYTDSFATLEYCMLTYSNIWVCNLSTVTAESAYLCLGWPRLGVWTHMGWLSFARWGMWLPAWRQGTGNKVKVRVGGRVREGGVQWLHCCTGFCYQYACSCWKRPWVVAWRWERGALAEGAAVEASLSFATPVKSSSSSWSTPSFCILSSSSSPASGSFSLEGLCLRSLCHPRCGRRRWWLALERWGLLPPGGALVPVLYDILVWPRPTAQAVPAGCIRDILRDETAPMAETNNKTNKHWCLPK